jgi:hypothetical protein
MSRARPLKALRIPAVVPTRELHPSATLERARTVVGENGSLMVASLRYRDTFVKVHGAWLFAERLLYVDWLEERTLS